LHNLDAEVFLVAGKPSYEELEQRIRALEEEVSARRLIEKALQIQKAYLEQLLECAPDGIALADKDHRITRINAQFTRLFGYTPEETIGRIGDDLIAPPERFDEASDISIRVGRGEPVRVETVRRRKDGSPVFVELMAAPVRVGDEHLADYVSYRDITERKQAEEVLIKREGKLQKLFDEAPVGYVEIDAEGRITQVNSTELAMIGYSAEEMLGQFVWKLAIDTEQEEARRIVTAKLSGAMRVGPAFERTFKRKDGAPLPVLIIDALIRDPEGKVTGIHAIYQDITERRRSEKEMADLQEQLRQSQKMEAVGRLAGGIAHDFNNLLTVIKGYADLTLLHLEEGDPLRGNIKEIDRASERAKDLTRQLLAFSRRQILQVKVLDLNALLLNMEKMFHRILGEDIQLLTVLDKNLGRVRVDPGEIEQVIMDLAVNARDAMPSGGKLTIETENVKLDEDYARAHLSVTPGHYVRLTVSDTGAGMSREVQERAFEPFFTTKEKGKGTGLGLSTVYGIIKQSGGNIWVYSEPGKGTTFKIYLPKIQEELDHLQNRGESSFFFRGTEVVLLVEDEAPLRALVAHFLRHQGYTVLEAMSGEEALRIAEENAGERIDLLLTDVVMPKMSGRELADRLENSRPGLKVLFASGYTDDAIVRHGVLEPGVSFLQKPFSLATLGQKIREVLDGAEAR
jgi:PAS domain S-box-containing protein